jgi:hypothetical protein
LTLPDLLDTTSEEIGIKLDWNISDQHRASLRYAAPSRARPILSASAPTRWRCRVICTSAILISSPPPPRFQRLERHLLDRVQGVLPRLLGGALPVDDRPAIGIRIGNPFLNLGTEENTHVNVLESQTWNAYFIGNWYLNDHEVKFGAEYETNDYYNLFGRRINGVYTFNSIADYRTGRSSRYQLFYPAGGDLDNMAANWGLDSLGPVHAGHLVGQLQPDLLTACASIRRTWMKTGLQRHGFECLWL